jgi:uncharacterized membrane protein (UPF0127 family)
MRPLNLLLATAALVATCANASTVDLPAHFATLSQSEVKVVTTKGSRGFNVWIAADDLSRARGLMFVRELPADRGMLFLFDRPQYAAFWMKNTYVSLDLVFIGPDGVVVNIVKDAEPLSLRSIVSEAPVKGVLELVGGTAATIGLSAGDRIVHPAFGVQQ